jgi:hypothetical protein
VSKSDLTIVAPKAGAEPHARTRSDAPVEQQPFATSVAGAVRLCGGAVGRSSIYEALRRGELKSRKCGACRIILISELRDWLQNLPSDAASMSHG